MYFSYSLQNSHFKEVINKSVNNELLDKFLVLLSCISQLRMLAEKYPSLHLIFFLVLMPALAYVVLLTLDIVNNMHDLAKISYKDHRQELEKTLFC